VEHAGHRPVPQLAPLISNPERDGFLLGTVLMLARGPRLGPYEIIEPLGSGGMGDVYRARDERLSRDVALKMISLKALDSPGSRRRFELEAKTLAAISHPNLVCVYDVGVEPDRPFLITELIDGDSLRQVLRKGRMSSGKALDIAIQIAAGLTAAHEAGIVHRDLKPENVMLTRGGIVKLIDFGLAKQPPTAPQVADGVTASLMTEPGMILGTVGYMSPEQASGSPVDFRSDQFSFACIVYELLTGEKAFTGKATIETLTAVLHVDPPHLSAEGLGVSTAMLWILKRCLAKDPARRFAATRDLYLDLEAARAQTEAIHTVQPRARVRWAPMLVIAAVAGAAAAALLAIGPSPQVVPKLTPLAIDAAVEREPKWSPDGSTLLYAREVNGILQVFTKNIASSATAQVTLATAPVHSGQPTVLTSTTRR
jgi:eukaryotic-like serine/threonine-protein kinase